MTPSTYPSHPTPSRLPSNLCGSGGTTRKLRCEIWPQSRSGGGGGMHASGYDEWHSGFGVFATVGIGEAIGPAVGVTTPLVGVPAAGQGAG